MRRTLALAFAMTLFIAVSAEAQIGSPGISYSGTIAGGDGVQLYSYDQQDRWLHGHFQRYPAYGGFASFRPYNYRHVFSQSQIASGWGSAHGLPYSQQYWNRYRGSYLNGNLHSQSTPEQGYQTIPPYQPSYSVLPAGTVRSISWEQTTAPVSATLQESALQESASTSAGDRPIHVFPGQ
jgi:hypothetical protein